MRSYRAAFFSKAEALVDSDSLSDDQLEHLSLYPSTIDNTAYLARLHRAVDLVEQENTTGKVTSNHRMISDEWAWLLFNYFMALTYLRHVKGWLVRARLTSLLEPKAGARNTVAIEQQVYSLA